MCLVLLCLVSHLGRTSSRCRKRLLLLVLTQQQQNRPPRCSQAFDCDQKEARAAGQKQHNTRNVALILCDAANPHMIFFVLLELFLFGWWFLFLASFRFFAAVLVMDCWCLCVLGRKRGETKMRVGRVGTGDPCPAHGRRLSHTLRMRVRLEDVKETTKKREKEERSM